VYGLEKTDFEQKPPTQSAPPVQFAEHSEYPDQRIVDDIGDLLADPTLMRATGDEILKSLLEFIDGAKS